MSKAFVFPPPPPPPPVSLPSSNDPRNDRSGIQQRLHGQWGGRKGRASNTLGRINWTQGSSRFFSSPKHSLGHQHHRPGYPSSGPRNALSTDPPTNWNQGQRKRQYGEAFQNSRKPSQEGHVAPPVPSFGTPVPPLCASTPLQPRIDVQATSTTPKATSSPPAPLPLALKNRTNSNSSHNKSNSLGLTPTSFDFVSSSEKEDVVDEEEQSAAHTSTGSKPIERLLVVYGDKTFPIKTPEDIAAWIAERRKRWPTHARAQEAAQKQRVRELTMAKEKLQLKRKQAQADSNSTKGDENLHNRKESKKPLGSEPEILKDETARTQQRIEKLRKQLEKEERKMSQAKPKSTTKKGGACIKQNTLRNNQISSKDSSTKEPSISETAHGDLETNNVVDDTQSANLRPQASPPTIRSEGVHPHVKSVPDTETRTLVPKAVPARADPSLSTSSSDLSATDTEDMTSSSGTSSSDDSSEDAPEQALSKKRATPRMPPPARRKAGPKHVCYRFMKHGNCSKGDKCQFPHVTKTTGPPRASPEAARHGSINRHKGRVSLYQRLVEQEKKGGKVKDREVEESSQIE